MSRRRRHAAGRRRLGDVTPAAVDTRPSGRGSGEWGVGSGEREEEGWRCHAAVSRHRRHAAGRRRLGDVTPAAVDTRPSGRGSGEWGVGSGELGVGEERWRCHAAVSRRRRHAAGRRRLGDATPAAVDTRPSGRGSGEWGAGSGERGVGSGRGKRRAGDVTQL